MVESNTAVAAELAKLRAAYLSRLPQELVELTQLAEGLAGQPDIRPSLETLHQRLHKLAGSGGTFGLKALSDQARVLEQRVKEWLASDVNTADEARRKHFTAAVAALSAALDLSEATISVQAPVTEHVATPADIERHVRIWLVEDDVQLGETLVCLLGQFGYEVRLFTRLGDTETAAAREECPDALIMDVMFPGEGVNAAEAMLASPVFQALSCPLLFISAYGDFKSRVLAARLGAEGFLLKPVDVPRLADHIERILEARHAAPYRVLIVDDDIDLSQHFRLVLSAAGMEVKVLNDPEMLIEVVSVFHPELVLMDMHMPGYSGTELATVIRHHDEWIGLPIVYLSAETDHDKQFQALSRGADDFLTKPISDAHLVAAVEVRAARSRQLADLMTRDSLTGLLKHAHIKEAIKVELTRAQRSGKPLSVAMLDIDHFKLVNDTYGHAAGDRVIKALSHLLRQRLRKSDSIGRYGGEEFVAILPECDIETARRVLEDIRVRFAALQFQHDGQEFACTLSAGIACTSQQHEAIGDELLVAADKALYAAKHGGRNQVRIAEATGLVAGQG